MVIPRGLVLGMAPRSPDSTRRGLAAAPHLGEAMANSKSKHMRMKSRRRQQWKARKTRQAAAKKTTTTKK